MAIYVDWKRYITYVIERRERVEMKNHEMQRKIHFIGS